MHHHHPASLHAVPLDGLDEGQEGRVVEIVGDSPIVTRLVEMGLRQGAKIRLHRRGQPCILSVDGRRLTCRLPEGVMILVEVSVLA